MSKQLDGVLDAERLKDIAKNDEAMRAADARQGFVASQPAIAGNPLYFTGIDRFDLVDSPYACHAQVFLTRQAAEAAVRPWNGLGHRFAVTLAAVAALAGCAIDPDDSVHADVHCTITQLVPIVVGDQVLMVDGKCVAWRVGPTPQEQRAFERQHQRGGAL